MQRSRTFWLALRSIPGAATARLEWQRLLGEDWTATAPLLRPTGEAVERVWCPSPGGEGCPRRVVRHADGRIVAVCGDLEGQCDTLDLVLDDIVVHELDIEKLAIALCKQLGLTGDVRPISLAGPVWQFGWYEPAAGQRFPMCMILPVESDQVHDAAVRLRGHFDPPFLLLTPTADLVEPATVAYLRTGRSRVLHLEDAVGIADGSWELLRSADNILGDFRHDVLGEVRFGKPEHRIPTPPGTSWREVMLRFINGHEVEVRVHGQSGGVFSYAHMGMVKANKDEPTVHWEMLRCVSDDHGEYHWPQSTRRKTVQKRRERLSRHLRNSFGIDDDPFEDLPKGRGFKTRFIIVPEQ